MKLSRPDTVCTTRFGSHTGAWRCSSAVWYEAMKRILAPIYFLPIPFFFLCPSRKEQAAQSNFIVCLPWAEMEETKRRQCSTIGPKSSWNRQNLYKIATGNGTCDFTRYFRDISSYWNFLKIFRQGVEMQLQKGLNPLWARLVSTPSEQIPACACELHIGLKFNMVEYFHLCISVCTIGFMRCIFCENTNAPSDKILTHCELHHCK